MNRLLFALLLFIVSCSYADKVSSLVEFFSFTCSHCANVNDKLNQYLRKNKIKYLDINIDDSPQAIKTTIMYYIAQDAGLGVEFKSKYFTALQHGLPAYTTSTLDYVVASIQNDRLQQLLHSSQERNKIKQKMHYAQALIQQYHIKTTPSFLLNQSILLEGENVVDSLIGANDE